MYKEKIVYYLKNTAYIILLLMILIGVAVTIYVGEFVNKNVLSVKSINQLELTQNPNSEIYADDGKTLIWTDAEYLHFPSTKENTPQIMIDLLLATEDHTFYENEGYSEKASFIIFKR